MGAKAPLGIFSDFWRISDAAMRQQKQLTPDTRAFDLR
jgi:hypothetical protein